MSAASRSPSAASRSPSGSLANPTQLEPLKRKAKESTSGTAKTGDELLQVVVETPRGSRNKYSFDEEQRTFQLKTTLPAGMVFPYDFGFIPKTVGGDGDPLDVLVLMEEPCFPGCVLLVRLLGVMEAEQTEGGKTSRNDRLIAVAETTQLYRNFASVADLPKQVRTEIATFFHNYHRLIGKESRTLAWKGPKHARRLIEEARQKKRAE